MIFILFKLFQLFTIRAVSVGSCVFLTCSHLFQVLLHFLAPQDVPRSSYTFPAQPGNEPHLQGVLVPLNGEIIFRNQDLHPRGYHCYSHRPSTKCVCVHALTHTYTSIFVSTYICTYIKITFTPIPPFHCNTINLILVFSLP